MDRLREVLGQAGPASDAGRAWVEGLTGRSLADGFDAFWEALTLPNRHRLLQVMVEEVVLDERGGALRIRLRDPRTLEREGA